MEMCGTVTLYGSDLYKQYEAKYGSKHNRKCINGKITGCGNCVGFCKYSGHPGFLTSKMRERHGCINKGCFYYVGKPARIREKEESSTFQNERFWRASKGLIVQIIRSCRMLQSCFS